jgi:hypothetical protein
MTDVLVAVPARDEERRVGACLASAAAALRHARDSGAATRVALAVGVHRSTDGTAEAVEAELGSMPDLEVYWHADDVAATVGEARHRVVTGSCAALGLRPSRRAWLFSTDADSVVPSHWVTAMLAHAHGSGAAAVAGLVDLDRWPAPPAAAAAYGRILRAGLAPDGHRHVYGANLAVRLDAYAGAGGFPRLAHGEDHGLVARLRERGEQVMAVHEPAVTTSARMPGRARHGLGDLLRTLTRGGDESGQGSVSALA